MLDFSGSDQKAQQVALHYAQEFNDSFLIDLINQKNTVKNKEDAIALAHFFWQVVDAAARDREYGLLVAGERNTQPWVERLLNIIGGYLKRSGYEAEWERVCDEV